MAGFPNSQSNPASAIPVWIAPGYANLTYLGFQNISDLSSAAQLTPIAGSLLAVVQAEGGGVRFLRDDTPTGTVGMYIAQNGQQVFQLPAADLEFIQADGGTSSLNVEYYGAA